MRHSGSESLQNDLVKNFDEIMLFVYEEATKPIDEYSESEHEENKSKFYKLLKEEIAVFPNRSLHYLQNKGNDICGHMSYAPQLILNPTTLEPNS